MICLHIFTQLLTVVNTDIPRYIVYSCPIHITPFTGIIVRVYIDIMFRMFCKHFKSELQFTNTLGNNDKSIYIKSIVILEFE